MLLNATQIKELQALLYELTGKERSPEEAYETGLAIMRYVYSKEYKDYLNDKGNDEEKHRDNKRA